VVPLQIQFEDGKKVFRDGVDMTPEHFFSIMKSAWRVPIILPVSDSEIQNAFNQSIGENDILGIFISQKFNASHNNALKIKESHYTEYANQRNQKYPGDNTPKIEIIDSKLVSCAMGLMVAEALEKTESGWSINRIRSQIQELIPMVKFIFMVNTLDYLKDEWQPQNVAVPENNMQIKKPLLSIQNGTCNIEMVDQVKDGKDAQQKIELLIRENLNRFPASTPIKAAIVHGNQPVWADEMSLILKNKFNCKQLFRSPLGPVASAHCGPGMVGVAYYPVTEH